MIQAFDHNCLTPRDATIERDEALGVASLHALRRAMHAIGAPRGLALAQLNLGAHHGTSSVSIGAPSPRAARASYTREARRDQRRRQLARRAGAQGLLRYLAAV